MSNASEDPRPASNRRSTLTPYAAAPRGIHLKHQNYYCVSQEPRASISTALHDPHQTSNTTALHRIHVRHPTPLRFTGSTSDIQHHCASQDPRQTSNNCASQDPRQTSNTTALHRIHVRHPTPRCLSTCPTPRHFMVFTLCV